MKMPFQNLFILGFVHPFSWEKLQQAPGILIILKCIYAPGAPPATVAPRLG